MTPRISRHRMLPRRVGARRAVVGMRFIVPEGGWLRVRRT